jgi:ribosomal protein L37AE/L43A
MKFKWFDNAVMVLANTPDYRSWAGNTGYEDREFSEYAFDDHVHSWHLIKLGTLLMVSQNGFLHGAGLVHSISAAKGEKVHLACPDCAKRKLDARANQSYYCNFCKEKFTGPELLSSSVPVTKNDCKLRGLLARGSRQIEQ